MATARLAASVASILFVGCASPRPYPEARGDLWVVPLVDQAADAPLLVPVYVHGQGPYVFKVDPDGPTLIDAEIYSQIDAVSRDYDRLPPEATALQWGTLTSHGFDFVGVAPHMLDYDGHRVYGAVGGNILLDSLVFGFNRDRGIAWLATRQGFHADPAAIQWSYYLQRTAFDLGAPRAPLVTATVNGKQAVMEIDLGQPTSGFRRSLWASRDIDPIPIASTIVDNGGTPHSYDALGEAQIVECGGVRKAGLRFAPYEDDRYYDGDVDGTLGLDFFRGYNVVVDWDHHDLYLTPTAQVAALR